MGRSCVTRGARARRGARRARVRLAPPCRAGATQKHLAWNGGLGCARAAGRVVRQARGSFPQPADLTVTDQRVPRNVLQADGCCPAWEQAPDPLK